MLCSINTLGVKILTLILLGKISFLAIKSLSFLGSVKTPKATSDITASTGSCGSCIFPFIFGNRIHESCTTIDGDSQPWCSTKVDANGHHVDGGGNWEYCTDSSCPGTSVSTTQQMSVNPLNAPGSCCKYLQTLLDSH